MLFRHPAIQEVALVGYPDERLGEKGCAIIVADGATPTLDDLQLYLAESGTARQYWPEQIKSVTEMPKTPAGKIQKYVSPRGTRERGWRLGV